MPAFFPKTVLLGAGKIAWHLGRRLAQKGSPPVQIVNRSDPPARRLAESIACAWTIDFQEIVRDADLYLLAVKDVAIADLAAKLADLKIQGLVAHTSGATPISVLENHALRAGVFWPLQSFSFEKTPVWSKTPICVDSPDKKDRLLLEKLARKLGARPFHADAEQRATLHLSAVFANNFANHCFALAEAVLREKNLPFDLLHPIMAETLAKALAASPASAQTGPALRGDAATMARHLALLDGKTTWQAVYRALSESIANPWP